MSTPTFTPGPWSIYEIDARVVCTRVDGKTTLVSEPATSVFTPSEYTIPHPTQMEANARLISAAPELFDALKALLADWQAVDPDEQVPDAINVDGHWEAARAAIAKAEGRA